MLGQGGPKIGMGHACRDDVHKTKEQLVVGDAAEDVVRT